ncbi:hypothetical protein [Halomonas sp. E19]|uniref:hypothetical protein n=1 Tax=Halomonas sp. E19 TaxID=3397247 RepID=UPI0040348F4E
MKGKAARQLKEESRLVRASGLFDDAWYLQQYPDVQQSGMPALEHFLRFGGREGRAPGPSFDTQWYLETYHDVAASDLNPLVHYLKFGKAEERRINAWHGN